jgi:hypothetical protein
MSPRSVDFSSRGTGSSQGQRLGVTPLHLHRMDAVERAPRLQFNETSLPKHLVLAIATAEHVGREVENLVLAEP